MNIYQIQHTDMVGEIRTIALILDEDLAKDVAARLNSIASNSDRISPQDRFRACKADNCFEGTAHEIAQDIVDRYFW